MSQVVDDRITTAPSFPPGLAGGPPRWLRLICTSNPFYVLSAGLFLAGLWVSFGGQSGEVETYALMSGLAGYTLLLAATACLLVRFASVWDDVRTILLLVVLMFLATSVTFDELLVSDPRRGYVFYIAGLLFSILISEGILRGIRLYLPVSFRVPYYLILGLFFLYPLALSPLLGNPQSEELMWGLCGFSTVAALVFLTLLPAIRQGAEALRGNGSPWRWPLYPWVLFGLLALAVPARAFLLCWSMHLLVGSDRDSLIFGLYFLLPFILTVGSLLLEIGIVGQYQKVIHIALASPLAMVAFALLGHRSDPIYQGFLTTFTNRLADPLTVALLLSVGFYAYAAVRRIPWGIPLLTGSLIALAVVGPETLSSGEVGPMRPLPILLAALLQLGIGVWQRDCWRCLLGSTGLVAVVFLAIPENSLIPYLRDMAAFHFALLAVLVLGAVFNDGLGQALRIVAGQMILLAALAVAFVGTRAPLHSFDWILWAYPLALACFLTGYGFWLRHRPSYWVAGLLGVGWLFGASWRGYLSARQAVSGLDHIALSLVLFAVAVLVSLGKAGLLSRWLGNERGNEPPAGGQGEAQPEVPPEPVELVQVLERSVTKGPEGV